MIRSFFHSFGADRPTHQQTQRWTDATKTIPVWHGTVGLLVMMVDFRRGAWCHMRWTFEARWRTVHGPAGVSSQTLTVRQIAMSCLYSPEDVMTALVVSFQHAKSVSNNKPTMRDEIQYVRLVLVVFLVDLNMSSRKDVIRMLVINQTLC